MEQFNYGIKNYKKASSFSLLFASTTQPNALNKPPK